MDAVRMDSASRGSVRRWGGAGVKTECERHQMQQQAQHHCDLQVQVATFRPESRHYR